MVCSPLAVFPLPCLGLGGRPRLAEAGWQAAWWCQEKLRSARWCLKFQAYTMTPITLCLRTHLPSLHPNQGYGMEEGAQGQAERRDFGSISTKGNSVSQPAPLQACSSPTQLLFPMHVHPVHTVSGTPYSQPHGSPEPQSLAPSADLSSCSRPHCATAAVTAALGTYPSPAPIPDAEDSLRGRRFIWGR